MDACMVGGLVGRSVWVRVGVKVDELVVTGGDAVVMGESTSQGSLALRIIQLIPSARPTRIIRLMITSVITPPTVMRTVHPSRRWRGRDVRGEPGDSVCLVIVAAWVNFTRCKKCAQQKPFLFLKTSPVELVVNTTPGEQLVMLAFLYNAPSLDDNDPVCTDHR